MILRSSLVHDFKQCPAKVCYKYEMGLTPIRTGATGQTKNDLEFGRLIHEAIEKFHLTDLSTALDYINQNSIVETKRKNLRTAKALIKAYATSTSLEMESLEKDFTFKVGSHTWKGRFDGTGFFQGKRWVAEHKTTNPFYLLTKPADQFIAYWIGALVHYQEVEGVLINSLDVDKLEVTQYPVTFTWEEKEEWREETKLLAETYKRYRTKGVFPRYPGACLSYNSMCPYIPLCSEPEGNRQIIMDRCYEVNESMKNLEW